MKMPPGATQTRNRREQIDSIKRLKKRHLATAETQTVFTPQPWTFVDFENVTTQMDRHSWTRHKTIFDLPARLYKVCATFDWVSLCPCESSCRYQSRVSMAFALLSALCSLYPDSSPAKHAKPNTVVSETISNYVPSCFPDIVQSSHVPNNDKMTKWQNLSLHKGSRDLSLGQD